MIERKRAIGSDLAKVDTHEITPEEYEEIPELTEEWFARAQLHMGGVPVKRGRPKAQNPKRAINLRLDPDVLSHFRASGPGWQRRINDTLRKAAKLKDKGRRPAAKARAAPK